MKIWITSDTHFWHQNIIKYENRPYDSVLQMNSALIKNWNDLIESEDIVYHLGNFGLGRASELRYEFLELNGKITLIRGHHDEGLSQLLSIGFDSIADALILNYKQWTFHMTHIPSNHIKYEDSDHTFVNLHGHTHGNPKFNKNRIDISMHAWDYKPVSLDNLIVEYKKYRMKNALQDKTHLQ